MTKTMLTVLLSALSLTLAGCGDSFEKVMEDRTEIQTEFVAVLKAVTDESSAKAAVPKLESLAERMKAVEAREKALGEPTEEDMKRVVEKALSGGMKDAPSSYQEIVRLNKRPELAQIIKPALTKYQDAE